MAGKASNVRTRERQCGRVWQKRGKRGVGVLNERTLPKEGTAQPDTGRTSVHMGRSQDMPSEQQGQGFAEAAGAPRSAWWIPSGRVGSVPFLNHLGTGEAWLALVVKNLPANAGDVRDVGSIAGSERPPGGGNGNPLQRSCLENPKDRGAWRATVHRVTKRQTQLKRFRKDVTRPR